MAVDGRKFGDALKKMKKAADASPEWFDFARRVLRMSDSGEMLLLHALMEGLKSAHQMGLLKEFPKADAVRPPEQRKWDADDEESTDEGSSRTPRSRRTTRAVDSEGESTGNQAVPPRVSRISRSASPEPTTTAPKRVSRRA